MRLTDEMKLSIGQEYFKRKIFRNIATWFKSFLDKYTSEQISNMIIENRFIIDDIEDDLLNTFPKEKILNHINEIQAYRNSMTYEDKENLAKMIYYQLPEYRDLLKSNPKWLNEYIKQALIAFDSYIFKIKS